MTDAPDVVARLRYYGMDRAADLIETQAARIPELEAECLEQSRIIGKGAERELALQARVAELEALADRLAGAAKDVCQDMTVSVDWDVNQAGQVVPTDHGRWGRLKDTLAAYEAKP